MKTFNKIIIFISMNIVVLVLCTVCLSEPSCTKLLLHEAQYGNYDILIMGQSHAYAGYNPYIVSEKLGGEAMDIARPSTATINHYYMLQEVNLQKKYKTVLFDIDYGYWDRGHSGRAGSDANLLFKLTGVRKIHYFNDVLLDSNYNDVFADYKLSGLGTIKNIPHNLSIKFSKDYRINNPDIFPEVAGFTKEGYYKYGGRGFYMGVDYMKDYYFKPLVYDMDNIKDENNDALIRMVDYCKENGINLICMSSALPPERLKNEEVEGFHNYFVAMCKKLNVPFYDMNYVKGLDRTGKDYIDKEGHMMKNLADKQTELMCQVIKNNNREKYFYTTYEDVLKNLGE